MVIQQRERLEINTSQAVRVSSLPRNYEFTQTQTGFGGTQVRNNSEDIRVDQKSGGRRCSVAK